MDGLSNLIHLVIHDVINFYMKELRKPSYHYQTAAL